MQDPLGGRSWGLGDANALGRKKPRSRTRLGGDILAASSRDESHASLWEVYENLARTELRGSGSGLA